MGVTGAVDKIMPHAARNTQLVAAMRVRAVRLPVWRVYRYATKAAEATVPYPAMMATLVMRSIFTELEGYDDDSPLEEGAGAGGDSVFGGERVRPGSEPRLEVHGGCLDESGDGGCGDE